MERATIVAVIDREIAPAEAAWAEEVERRVRQIDSGEIKTIPWEQVRANLYARLNGKR